MQITCHVVELRYAMEGGGGGGRSLCLREGLGEKLIFFLFYSYPQEILFAK